MNHRITTRLMQQPVSGARQLIALLALTTVLAAAAWGQGGGAGRGGPLVSLKQIPVPQPAGLATYVRDQASLVALGKALFWDAQVGSDGKIACASCHFHAGADHRTTNILSAPAAGGGPVAANQTVNPASFPFHQLTNVGNNASPVVRDLRQVAGSPGVVRRTFLALDAGKSSENGVDVAGGAFSVGGLGVRQVGTRNAPSVINSVFQVRNFWDGRASRLFTGQTPFGASDTALNAVAFRNGQLVREAVAINNASLASQSVGPPMNTSEMSYNGRSWPLLGRKLLRLTPLAGQLVAPDDSVLGSMANPSGYGLQPAYSYTALVQAAFHPLYWNGAGLVDGPFTQMEANFALYWGLAIQAYEATLVSDNTRLDQFLEGNAQLTALEQQGMQVFQGGRSQCTQCHQGAEFSAASFSNSANVATTNNDPDDVGFFRTGVSPLAEDPGFGANDDFGRPLFAPSPTRAAGTFKSPSLRNVEFTGPYFHNGGQATLEQVMQFYARNGDFPAGGNLGPGIGQIGLSPADQTALVAFMKALSDDRVRFEQAPFDHPSLCIASGAPEVSPGMLAFDSSDPRFTASAAESFALIPAVGRSGNTVPLQTFEELLAGIGADGSRAHNLRETCGASAVIAAPRIDAVTHAATFLPGAVSPGEIVAIFGSNLTGAVAFDGVPATIVYRSLNQMNVTVPYSVAGPATTLQLGSTALALSVVPASPGIFAAVSSVPGVITLYGTGGGSLSQDALPQITLPSSVTVNGQDAQVLYVGIAPGLVEGVNQINVKLPAGTETGALTIVWKAGGFSSKPFVLGR
ncbi:MAG: cytochrome c peroxidase [Candidatus Solibacter sp.]